MKSSKQKATKFSTSPASYPLHSDYVADYWLWTEDPNSMGQQRKINNTAALYTYLTPGFAFQNWDYPPPERYLLSTWTPDAVNSSDFWEASGVKDNSTLNDICNVGHVSDFSDLASGNSPLLGAGIQVWSDGTFGVFNDGQTKPDSFFYSLAFRPLTLIAAKGWSKTHYSLNLSEYIDAVHQVGEPKVNWPLSKKVQCNNPFFLHQNNSVGFSYDLPVPWTIAFTVDLSENVSEPILFTTSNYDMAKVLMYSEGNKQRLSLSSTGYQNGAYYPHDSEIPNCAGRFSPVGKVILNSNASWTAGDHSIKYTATREGIQMWINGTSRGSSIKVMNLPLNTIGHSDNPAGTITVTSILVDGSQLCQ